MLIPVFPASGNSSSALQVTKSSHKILLRYRGSSHLLSSWNIFSRDSEWAFLQRGFDSLWCYVPAAVAGGTKSASYSLCWQTEPRAISGSWAAEVRLSAPPALNTFECPRDEFCSYRVLELCPKEKKSLQTVLRSRIYPVLPRDVVFWIWGKSGLVKAWFKQNTSFMALLHRREIFEPGFPACGSCFHAGCPPVHDSTGICVQLPCRWHHSFTQDNYPGGTEVCESSHVAADQEPV